MNNMRRLRVALAWSLIALLTATETVRAQSRLDLDQPPADAWLKDALVAQRRLDRFGSFVGAPSALLLGGAALLLPAAVDLGPVATAAYLTSGLSMLSAALGAWAISDPYESQRWYALSASLGFVALGGGLVLSCVERDDGCSERAGSVRRFFARAICFSRKAVSRPVLCDSARRTGHSPLGMAGAAPHG